MAFNENKVPKPEVLRLKQAGAKRSMRLLADALASGTFKRSIRTHAIVRPIRKLG